MNFIKQHFTKFIIITIYSLLLGTCSYQATALFSKDSYIEARKFYSDKSCAKLSCEEPSSDCMEFCYKKEAHN